MIHRWFETQPSITGLHGVREVRNPSGERVTRVDANIPEHGLRCMCYEGMNWKDIAPGSRPFSMETRCGPFTHLTCNCNNRMSGSQVPFEAMPQIISSPTFREAAARAVCGELGKSPWRDMKYVSEAEQQRRWNYPVVGGALLLVGGAVTWWLYKRSK